MPHTILFIGADAGGNVPPMHAIARELAGRGHRIAFAGLRPPDPSWEHLPLPAIAGREPGPATSGSAQTRGLMRMGMSVALARQAAEAIVGRRPDAVVVDSIMISSIRAAVRSGAPVATVFHSFGALWSGAMWQGAVNAALRPFGLSPQAVWCATGVRLVVTDREIDPLTDEDDTIGFDWTGTTERGATPIPRAEGTPARVLVSLSSVWQKDQDDVYREIIAALGTLPVQAIVTRATPADPFRGDVPANVELHGRTSHATLLPRADLLIGHGGHSTTLLALAHGVPLLVLPMNRGSDQPLIGRIVQDNGLGLALPRAASAAVIGDAVARILADQGIAERAASTGRRLRAQDGAAVAADRIEALAAP